MKKFMKKKVNVFGKKLPVFVIALFAIGLVSAALVPYISNTITGNVVIDSPMIMSFDGDNWGETATKDFGIIYGGATFSYKSWSKNQGSIDLNSYPIMTIISNNEWVGEEFTYVHFKDNDPANAAYYDANPEGYEILDRLYVVKDNGDLSKFTDGGWKTAGVADKKALRLIFDNSQSTLPYLYPAGVESWNEITVTTKSTIAPDTYTIKLCHIDNLVTGHCV